MQKIDVLDHGFVRLVDSMGSDVSVVRAARVSYDAAWRAGENEGSDAKLINYLWKNKHSTPFESVTFTFEVKAPIFVLRQWHRHRTMTYNEVSARYTELPSEFYIPSIDLIGAQSKTNKQQRVIESEDEDTLKLRIMDLEDYTKICNDSYAAYQKLIATGWPRELARAVLPVSTYSHMFVTVNLLNLLKFITLRDHSHAQYEIRVYAQALRELIEPIVPEVIKAFDNNQATN